MKLKALSNINHDGETYEAGDVFDVGKEDQAEALLEAGAAEKAEDGAKAAEKATDETDADKTDDGDVDESEEKDLNDNTVAELKAMAAEDGVDITGMNKKADLVKALSED